jgi:hypothetical protein
MRIAFVIAAVAIGTMGVFASSARADDTGAGVGVGVGPGGVGVNAGAGIGGTGASTGANVGPGGVGVGANVGQNAYSSGGYYYNGQRYDSNTPGYNPNMIGTGYNTGYYNNQMYGTGYNTGYAGGYSSGGYSSGGYMQPTAYSMGSGYYGAHGRMWNPHNSGYTGGATYFSESNLGGCGCQPVRCDPCARGGLFGNGGFLGTGLFR